MIVDILVTTYKRAEDLLGLMKNLEAQTYPSFRLQIFDGSPDDSVAEAVTRYLESRGDSGYPVVFTRTPAGMTKQRNMAVDAAAGDLAIFLDDDVLLGPDYLERVVDVFRNDRDCRIAGANGFAVGASGSLGLRQRLFRAIGLLPNIGQGRYLPWGHGTPHWEGGGFSGIRECDLLIGFNMIFRTSLLKKFRFDVFFEQYPGYVLYDDQDICLRMKKEGFRLVQIGNARLRHLVSPHARPPGYIYGFQTVFNAFRNWKVHFPEPDRMSTVRFWLWEYLNALFLFVASAWHHGLLDQVRGRFEGIRAARRGCEDYQAWVAEVGRKGFS